MGNKTNKRGRPPKNTTKAKKSKKSESPEISGDELDKGRLLEEVDYDYAKLLSNPDFVHDELFLKMQPSEFTMDYIRETGLRRPMLFTAPPSELGMKMPDPNFFGVGTVMELVGHDRIIDVVHVKGQKAKTMKLNQFIQYYLTDENKRHDLFNVLSLEFTLTKMEEIVVGPKFVKEIDWVETCWPSELKKRQEVNMAINGKYCTFSTFPKVQRYCLMSVKDCFTDFHIDFGGTSVWYHVLKGKKIFWIIEPTEHNMKIYESWLRSDISNKSFFGDIVEKCARIELTQGNTFIIPSGWIHSVFTPQDSLVFGGNFLHSYAIPMQLSVAESEDNLKIGIKYRFTYFKQMLWYVIEKYVREATGRKYLKRLKVNPLNKKHLDDLIAYKLITEGKDHKPTSNLCHELPDLRIYDEQKPECKYEIISPDVPGPSTSVIYNNVGMEMEENENDNPNRVNVENIEYSSNGKTYEVCYDSDSDDDVHYDDPNYRFLPFQTNISKKNFNAFVPTGSYNDEYLSSLTKLETDGFPKLLQYMKEKVLSKSRKIEYPEGITRPHHLISEFSTLCNYIKQRSQNLEKDVKSDFLQNSCLSSIKQEGLTNPIVNSFYSTSTSDPKIKESLDTCLNLLQPHNTVDLDKNKEVQITSNIEVNCESVEDKKPLLNRIPKLPQKPNITSNVFIKQPYGVSKFDPRQDLIELGKDPHSSAYRKVSNNNQSSTNLIKQPPSIKPFSTKFIKENCHHAISRNFVRYPNQHFESQPYNRFSNHKLNNNDRARTYYNPQRGQDNFSNNMLYSSNKGQEDSNRQIYRNNLYENPSKIQQRYSHGKLNDHDRNEETLNSSNSQAAISIVQQPLNLAQSISTASALPSVYHQLFSLSSELIGSNLISQSVLASSAPMSISNESWSSYTAAQGNCPSYQSINVVSINPQDGIVSNDNKLYQQHATGMQQHKITQEYEYTQESITGINEHSPPVQAYSDNKIDSVEAIDQLAALAKQLENDT